MQKSPKCNIFHLFENSNIFQSQEVVQNQVNKILSYTLRPCKDESSSFFFKIKKEFETTCTLRYGKIDDSKYRIKAKNEVD